MALGALTALVYGSGVGASTYAPVGIYTGREVPADSAHSDPNSVEVGTQFSVSVPGTIVALRYYKSAKNSGVHTGTLWSADGKKMATVTFSSHRSYGWQTAQLSRRVAVVPGATYVASYHTSRGYYAQQTGTFDDGRAIGNSLIRGTGGVIRYGATGFPTQTGSSDSSFYVDALFRPSAGGSGVARGAPLGGYSTVVGSAAPIQSTPTTPSSVASVTVPVAPGSVSAPSTGAVGSAGDAGASFASLYKKWKNGPNPNGDPTYFPIGVFYQSFDRPTGTSPTQDSVLAYINAGINLQVGGYDCDNGGCPGGARDPNLVGAVKNNTAAHPVHCACDVMGNQTGNSNMTGPFKSLSAALAAPSTTGAVLKAHFITNFDEADMNQVNLPKGSYLSAPGVNAAYAAIKAADSTRPVVAGYGKCFAIPNWIGCQASGYSGNGMSTQAALQMYCANADMISSDYYANDRHIGDGPGHNYEYGLIVDNTRNICGSGKVIGFDVNTGNLGGGDVSPADIKAATWDGIMHGANFVNYFVDDINASNGLESENGLLQPNHTAQLAQVTADNNMIHALAPWLNAPSQSGVSVTATNGIPVTTMLKTYGGHTYLFAMADGNSAHPTSGSTSATVSFPANISATSATVYGEGRSAAIANHSISDSFSAYQVHIYQLS